MGVTIGMETLAELLEKASQAMGVAVEQVYAVLLQQAKVVLVFDIIVIIGLLALTGVGVFAIKYCRKRAKGDYYSEWHAGVVVSSTVTAIIAGVSFLGAIPTGIREIVQILVNPPVWVLEYLAKMFS